MMLPRSSNTTRHDARSPASPGRQASEHPTNLAADRRVLVLDHHPDERLRPAWPKEYTSLLPEPIFGFHDRLLYRFRARHRAVLDGDVYEDLRVTDHYLCELRERLSAARHHVQDGERCHEPIPSRRIF